MDEFDQAARALRLQKGRPSSSAWSSLGEPLLLNALAVLLPGLYYREVCEAWPAMAGWFLLALFALLAVGTFCTFKSHRAAIALRLVTNEERTPAYRVAAAKVAGWRRISSGLVLVLGAAIATVKIPGRFGGLLLAAGIFLIMDGWEHV